MDFSHSSRNRKGGSDEDGNVNADNFPENSREIVQNLKEIVNLSEQEIYAMLVECNMDADEAFNRLLSQDGFQQVKSKRDKKKEAKKKSRRGRRYVVRNINADNVQGFRNHLAGSSTSAGILGPYPSLNSDVSNVETKGVTISSGEAVPSLSGPSSRYQSARGCGTSGQGTVADVVKMDLGSSKESVTKAPVKDDSLLPEKPVVPNSFSNSLTESASVSKQKHWNGDYGGSQLLCDYDNNKNDETNQLQLHSIEHNQNGFQQVKSKRDKKKEAKKKSRRGRRYVGRNINADNVQGFRNHLAGSSTSAGILGPYPSLNSDVSNVETKGVTISSGEAVSSLSVPSSRYQSARGCGTSGQGTADVVKMDLGSSKENVTKASVKDDSLLPEKPVVPNSFSNSFTESALVSKQNVCDGDYGGSRWLYDYYNNINDETNQLQRRSIEHNQNPLAPVNLDTAAIKELQQLTFGRFTGMNGSGEPSGLSSRFLDDDSKDKSDCPNDLSLSNLSIRDGECHVEEEQRLGRNVGNEQMAYPMNSNATPNYHSSSNYDQTEPTQESQYNSSYATFTFCNCQLLNPVVAPSSLQMQNFCTFPNAVHQQAYTREPDACSPASPLNQSVPTAISLGRGLSVSVTEAPLIASLNEPQMNQYYSQPNTPSGRYGTIMNYPYSLPTPSNTYMPPSAYQPNVPSGHYGAIMNYSYSLPTPNNTYMPPSAYQQHGGSNNNVYDLPSIVAPLPQYINSDLWHYHRSSSAYSSGMSSYNAANLGLGYDDVFSSQFNHLASLQHLNGNSSNVWTPPLQGHNDSGRNYYSNQQEAALQRDWL